MYDEPPVVPVLDDLKLALHAHCAA